MARIRSVHPNICLSESMAALPAEIERTYVRLWTHCDDYGRCVDNVKLIKAAIFPLVDDVTCDALDGHLDRLVAGDHLIGYEIDGRRYLQVREWKVYQHPQRPRDSVIPVVDDAAKRTRVLADVSGPVVGEGEVDEEGLRRGRGACTDASRPRNGAQPFVVDLPKMAGADPECPQCQGRGVKGYAPAADPKTQPNKAIPCDCTLEGYEPRPPVSRPPSDFGMPANKANA